MTVLLLITLCAAGLTVGSNIWLAHWADADGSPEQSSYLIVYVVLGCANAVFLGVQAVVLTWCALRASRALHDAMLSRLLGAPMKFFDLNPSGRILNRFLQVTQWCITQCSPAALSWRQDLQNVDNYVPNAVLDQVTKSLTLITQLTLVGFFAPWVLLCIPFLLMPYYLIFSTVRVAARDTRRGECSWWVQ